MTEPEIFLLDEPTRGIDVGAKYEIYTIMTELAKQGKSIIFISSEMPELIGMADRIMVMCEGRLSGFVSGEEATQENIMRLATQIHGLIKGGYKHELIDYVRVKELYSDECYLHCL